MLVERSEPATFLEREKAWRAGDGKVLPFEVWAPGEEAEVSIWVLVHGFGGASSDFKQIGERLSAEGAIVYAPDLRGMGRDPDLQWRGDIKRARDWVMDLEEFSILCRRRHPGVPVFIGGESLGSSIVVNWLVNQPSDRVPEGVVILSPVVDLGSDLPWWQRQLFRITSNLMPRKTLDLASFEADFGEEDLFPPTPVPAELEALARAPHALSSVTWRLFREAARLINSTDEVGLERIDLPILLVYGGRDLFARSDAVAQFARRLEDSGTDRRVVFFPDGHHLLMRDYVADDLFAIWLEWYRQRLRG